MSSKHDYYKTDDKYLHVDISSSPLPLTHELPDKEKLKTTCLLYRAIGVASNQLGFAHPWVYMAGDLGMTSSKGVGLIMLKPHYTPAKPDTHTEQEGCISLPGRAFMVRRYNAIHAQWTSVGGTLITKRLTGFQARVFQHECDHLQGKTLVDTCLHEITKDNG